jgi:2-oxo-3-hexenedioate decarboxylase
VSKLGARIEDAASRLLAAEHDRIDGDPLTDEWPDLDLATAYRIQDETLRQRLDRGERVIGIKLGLTSAKKQKQMNVHSPLTAWLTDAMALPSGVQLPRHRLIHPRVEPEIVFVIGERLVGPGITAKRALAAVDQVLCGFEIIDSRYKDFRFTLPDVVADNASSSYFVTGPLRVLPTTLDLAAEGCSVAVDGTLVASGTGAEVQGHPAEALALAANALAARGHAVEAGWIVLTGGMTDAVSPGMGSTIEVRFTNLGSITLHC